MIQPAALLAAACALALAAASPSEVRGAAMTFVAKGPFDVKVTPLDPRPAGEPAFGRLRMDKTFHGGLEATSTGEMLSWGGAGGAAAYVALDHVEGTLDGRRGTFVLGAGRLAARQPSGYEPNMSRVFAFILVVSVSGAVPAPTSSPASVEVAVTVDDLPQHGPTIAGQTPLDLARRMARTLRAHAVPPVYGFVNASRADEDPSLVPVLTTWRDEGQVLGNHTYSHKSLDATALADYLADVTRDEALLARLEPTPAVWHVFRYPFLFEGKDLDKRRAVKRFLAEHGYRIAEVSIDADDWAFNPPFARCSALGKTSELARLRGDFVAAHVDELRRMRALGRQLTGGEIRHVLLLHLGVADADALDALLTALEHEGARWVSLDRALDDPFYAGDPDIPFAGGAAFPYVVARARGVKVEPPIYARGLEQRLEQTCR